MLPAEARERCAALESLASVPQPEALVRDLHGRLCAASAAAGVPSASAMDLATAAALLGRDAANSFGVCYLQCLAVGSSLQGQHQLSPSLWHHQTPHGQPGWVNNPKCDVGEPAHAQDPWRHF